MSGNMTINIDKDKNQNLMPMNKENNDYSEKRHEKIQSFEIASKTEFDKQFPYKDREMTIQYEHNQRFSGSSINDTQQSLVIVENLKSDDNLRNSSNKEKTKNNKKGIKYFFYNKIPKIPINHLKFITITMIIFYIIVGIISCMFYAIMKNENPFLFCFNFIKRTDEKKEEVIEGHEIFFLSDINSFGIIHVILCFIFIKLLITFFSNWENDIKSFFKYFSILFDLTLFVNIPVFILGITSNYNGNAYWKVVLDIILTGLGTLFTFIVYLKSKSVKFKNMSRLINQGILAGILACFELYSLIYNICILITWGADLNNLKMEMIPGSFFFIISFFYTFFYKDIIFPITTLIIQIGLLYIKRNESSAFSLCIFNVSVATFNCASIILTIFKYNKKVFRFLEEVETEKKE